MSEKNQLQTPVPPLVEGTDYYIEKGRWVFTAHYHQKRGYCCESGCRHCPYNSKTPQNLPDATANPTTPSTPR